MAPTYKPLPIPSGLSAPPPVFTGTENLSFMDADAQWAQQRARELANQNNEVAVAEATRQAQEEKVYRDGLIQQFGTPDANGVIPEFNPDDALQVAQRLALGQGDIDRALAIERATREHKANSALDVPLDPATLAAYRQYMPGLPDGATERMVQGINKVRGTSVYSDQVHDPRLARNRELNATLQEQRATGTQVRPLTPGQVAKLGAGNAFIKQMEDMEARYVPYISENRGARFLAIAANPNSAAARLQGELELAAKQAALSLEDRVTDQDFQTIREITKIQNLDTIETVLDRMARLKQFIQRRNDSDLELMQKHGFNTEERPLPGSFQIPKAQQPAGAPERPGMTYQGTDEATGLPIYKKVQ